MDAGITNDHFRRKIASFQDGAERGSMGKPEENNRLDTLALPSRLIRVMLECSGPPFSGEGSRGSMKRKLNQPSTFSNGEANMSFPQLPL